MSIKSKSWLITVGLVMVLLIVVIIFMLINRPAPPSLSPIPTPTVISDTEVTEIVIPNPSDPNLTLEQQAQYDVFEAAVGQDFINDVTGVTPVEVIEYTPNTDLATVSQNKILKIEALRLNLNQAQSLTEQLLSLLEAETNLADQVVTMVNTQEDIDAVTGKINFNFQLIVSPVTSGQRDKFYSGSFTLNPDGSIENVLVQ